MSVESKPSPHPREKATPEEEPEDMTAAKESPETPVAEKSEETVAAKRFRLTGRSAVAAAVVIVVALAAVVGVLFFQYRSADNDAAGTADGLDAAKTLVPKLLSYDHATFDADVVGAVADTTGTFHDDFNTLMTRVVKPTVEQQEVTTRSTVAAASVIDGSENQVVVLLFVDQSTTAKGQQGTKVGTSNVRATVQRVDGHWLVSDLHPV